MQQNPVPTLGRMFVFALMLILLLLGCELDPVMYSFSYDANGATGSPPASTSFHKEGTNLTIAGNTGNLNKSGYTFNNWNTRNDGSGTTYLAGDTFTMSGQDVVLYAQWTPSNNTAYRTEYYHQNRDNDDYTLHETVHQSGVTNSQANPAHKIYIGFTEHTSHPNTIESAVILADGSLVLKLYYSRSTYTVFFESNEGSHISNLVDQKYGTLLGKPNDPTREGYIFLGWYKEAGLSTAWDFDTDVLEDTTTLYAKWSPASYTITYHLDSGTNAIANPVTYTVESPALALSPPTRNHYTFEGWYETGDFSGSAITSIPANTSANMELYAKWSVNSYKVSFNANGGVGTMDDQSIPYNTQQNLFANRYSRNGYRFVAWNTQADGSGSRFNDQAGYTMESSFANLYAQWEPNSYTVTFITQGGTAADPPTKQVTFGSSYGSLATSSRDGYTLAGWYHDSIGSSSLFTESSPVTLAENHSLLAHWDAITYDLAYNLGGGTNSQDNPANYSIQSETITLSDPARDGYDFVGWYAEDTFTTPVSTIFKGSMGDKTLYAKWTAATYSIHYELNSGVNDLNNATTYTILDTAHDLFSPTRSHYTFDGWYTDREFTGGSVQAIPSGSFGDRTFFAKWIPDCYTITYVLNNGTNASANPADYTIETPSITFAAPTRLHHDFGGWHATSDLSGSVVDSIPTGSTGNKTLYAKWTLKDYYVLFSSNGGTGSMENQAIPYNTQENLAGNTFSRTGYSFIGWNTQANGLGDTYANGAGFTIGGSNINLYAQWQKNTYTLTFNKNGGTGTTLTQNLQYNTSTPLTANSYSRTGYTFSGWATSSSGTVKYQDKANYSIGAANANLYAKWTPLSISITFDEEGGTETSPQTIYRDYNTAYGTLPSTTRTGYLFGGWWTGDNGTVSEIKSTTTVTSTTSHYLYAKWTPSPNTAYKVEHYHQDVNGAGYTLFETENKTGTTATQVSASAKTYTDFNYNSTISTFSGTIAANGSLVLKLYYDRKTYTVTFQSNGGSIVTSYSGIRHGATILSPSDPAKSGYVFNLWYADSALTQRYEFANQTITKNTTLYAKWWSGGVGDIGPSGGVVFHDKGSYSDGWRYLEAACCDVIHPTTGETTFTWGGKAGSPTINNTLVGGTSQAVGTGETNTSAIATYTTVASAARFCSEAFSQGGYSDWFLPSLNELELMGKLSDTKSGAFTLLSGVYWSSSEKSAGNAYFCNVTDKIMSDMPKTWTFRLRASRSF